MNFKENKLVGGGGNSLKPSHNQDFSLIEAFNNLSPSGEGKEGCVGEMKENNFLDKVYSLFTTHHSLKSAAFTLAEVLVTLGIIGVVSAMTVPTLMQNYQRQSYVTQLHKVYNETSQVFLRYMTDRNAINLREAGISSQAEMNNVITNYFKITNSCLNPNEVKPCFAAYSDYKKISGQALEYWGNNSGAGIGMSYILASGASVRFYYVGRDNLFISLVTDINGPKGPNILGRDMFDMTIDVNGNIDTSGYELPLPLTQEQRENAFQNICIADNTYFGGCFGKILNDNWQMNY